MLSAKQKKCLEHMVLGELSQKQIAEQINVAEKTICEWKKNSEFMEELDTLIKLSIRSLAAKAFNTHKKLLDAKSEMVRYMVAKDVLDRAGFKPTDKIRHSGEINNPFEELTTDELRRIAGISNDDT